MPMQALWKTNVLKSKDAKSWVIRAASQAQKAANYILNIQPEV